MESQVELDEERVRLRDKFIKTLPDLMKSELGQVDMVYQDGALSKKVKRLIALGIALRATCTNCILAQTQRALEAGATNEEILETLAIAVSMSGTTGIGESLRVVKFLEELGKL